MRNEQHLNKHVHLQLNIYFDRIIRFVLSKSLMHGLLLIKWVTFQMGDATTTYLTILLNFEPNKTKKEY